MADMPSSVREDGRVGSSGGSRAGRPKRRSFTAAYKVRILEEFERLSDPGERGALLRREGLYHSHVQSWREARDQGVLTGLSAKPVGRPSRSDTDIDNERLRKENERLTNELAKTRTALDIVGKAHALLELLSRARTRTGTRPRDRGGFR